MIFASLATFWEGQSGLELLADSSGILLLLAAGFLVFRSFRERYLLAWIAGWGSYLVYRVAGLNPQYFPNPAASTAVAQVAFVVAVAFFVAAVLYYTNQKKWLVALAIIAAVTVDVVVVRAVWWPDSLAFSVALRVLYMTMTVGGALQLVLFNRGRRQLGLWMITVMLLLLHLDEHPSSTAFLAGIDMAIELLLGLGMLVVVLDDSKARTDRLAVANAITGAIAQAQDYGSMMLTALEELKKLMRARAAWFRLLDGDSMVLTHQAGLSEQFLRARGTLEVRTSYGAHLLRLGLPAVLRATHADEATRRELRNEGFDHLVLTPMKGKTSMIGVICLGFTRHPSYRAEELHFLASTANQIGIAVENLRLLEQIIRSHRQWISTFDSIDDLILVHDAQYRILKLNRATLERLGHPYQEVIFQTCEEVLPHQGGEWQGCPYCAQTRPGFGEAPDPCFGGYSLVSTSSFSDQTSAFVGTIHIIRDTTERRQAEERFRMLFEQVQEGVFLSNPEGRLLDCNDAFVRMLGYESKEEVLALDIARQIYVAAEQRQAFCEVMAEHNYVRNYEVLLRRKDGSTLTVLENSFATRDPAGAIVRYQGFLLDITEKKRAEDEIKRRNRELAALNAIAVVATHSFDLDEILPTALQQVVELFGADAGGVYLVDIGKKLLRRHAAHGHRSDPSLFAEIKVPPDFWSRMASSGIEVLTDRSVSELPEVFSEFVRREGLRSWVWIIMRAKDKMVGVLGVSSRSEREFSETEQSLMVAIGRQLATTIEKVRLYEETLKAYEDLQRTQEQLLQSEKMSAVGQLISGVAHELNNPLTAILGYAQLLENENLSDRARDFLQKLFKQAQRTQRLVQNLLSFARQRKPAKLQVDIRQVVEDTLALRDYDLRLTNIEVARHYAPDVPAVVADVHQMEQVFLNIINNAADAVLQVGPGGRLQVSVYPEAGQVCVEFRDNGPGIREPHRVFDPFYTTKGVGKGTGLGLSICYGIVKEHSGEIRALNHPQGGAVFRVLLPASVEESVTVTPAAPAGEEMPLQGRILLVDDEEAVLEFEREVLSQYGAAVVCYADAEQALVRLQQDEYDAIFLDCTMPGRWSGRNLYEWLVEHRPSAARTVVFTLSNISDPGTRAFLEDRDIPWITKPFQVAELVSAARRVLQRSRALTAG
jgi:PAS domain S-box-containing protein